MPKPSIKAVVRHTRSLKVTWEAVTIILEVIWKMPAGSIFSDTDLKFLLSQITHLTREAGAKVMSIYATDFQVTQKDDKSPVTEADILAEKVIKTGLSSLAPVFPIVAEESAAAGDIHDVEAMGGDPFWLVDPVDGTREFLNRNGEFTVNVALIMNRRPVLGVVYAPALKTLYAGIVGQGATRAVDDAPPEAIQVRMPPEEGITVIASRSHGDPEVLKEFLAGRSIAELKNAGSSLKFCLIAAGEADLYPRFGRTMEWDTAAGQAVLESAGGTVTREDGSLLDYAKNVIFENPNFIAWGGQIPASNCGA